MSEAKAFELGIRDGLNRRLSGCFEMIADARMAATCSEFDLLRTILQKLMGEIIKIDGAAKSAPQEIRKVRDSDSR